MVAFAQDQEILYNLFHTIAVFQASANENETAYKKNLKLVMHSLKSK